MSKKYFKIDGKIIEFQEPKEFEYTEKERINLNPENFVDFHMFLIKVDNPDRWNRYLRYIEGEPSPTKNPVRV